MIDCGPLLNVLSLNAVFACDLLLVPVSADYLSLQGASEVERALNALEPVFKRRLPRRYVLTRYDVRRKMSGPWSRGWRVAARRGGVRDAHPRERQARRKSGGRARHLPSCAGQPRRARLPGAVRGASWVRLYGVRRDRALMRPMTPSTSSVSTRRGTDVLVAFEDLAVVIHLAQPRSASSCVRRHDQDVFHPLAMLAS